jgi:tetratricopeptide (TPR) repeat protein
MLFSRFVKSGRRPPHGQRAGALSRPPTLGGCFSAIFGGVILLLWPPAAPAHGPLHEQIELISQEIKRAPRDAELYWRRGELHRLHGDWDLAYADYDRAAAVDPNLDVVDLGRGRLFLEANWPQSAKRVLDRFLSRHTNHVDALITRARVQVKLGQPLAAADDFSAAIAYSHEAGPELYIERAQAFTAAGGEYLRAALKGLDDGIRKLGPLVTLQLYAIDLEIKLKRFDEALSRLDQVAAQSPRKETWLARKGEILQQAGRGSQAQEAFQAALAAINRLPLSRRNVPAMKELEERVREALQKVGPARPH